MPQNESENNLRTIVLVGAARSGTKILRDTIASSDGVSCVPYDINYLWRIGNENSPHDSLRPESIDDRQAHVISSLIRKYAGSEKVLVEKTVSSCLRVKFVRRVLPESDLVILLRDGYEVTESAIRQWQLKPDWKYVARKATRFPFLKAPKYAAKYAKTTAAALFRNQTSTWGPRYEGMAYDLECQDLAYVCARQWAESVTQTLDSVVGLDRVWFVSYSDFVDSPRETLEKLAQWLQIASLTTADVSRVLPQSAAAGKHKLTQKQLAIVSPIIDPVMQRLDDLAHERQAPNNVPPGTTQ